MRTPSTTRSSTSNRPTLPRNVWIVTITSFLTDISSEMVFNLLPLYLSNVLGIKTNIIGVIEGIAETTASVLKTFSGWLSDRLRQRKRLTVLGYAISAVSKPFLYLTTTWTGVLGVRVSDRIGKGIRTAPRDALIADTINEHQRGAAFGLHRAGDTAGAALGILIALLVVLLTQSGDLALKRSTFQTVVLLSIIPAFAAVIVLALGAHDVPITSQRKPPRLSLRGLDRQFRWLLLAVIVFTLGNSADAFLILRAQERGTSVAGVLAMLFAFNIVYTVISGPAGALSDKVGRQRIVIGGWTAYAVLYLGFALANAAWHIWVLYAAYGIYYGATEGTLKALIADLVAPEQRGTAYGVFNTAVGIVALPASAIAGVLWQGAFGWNGFGARAPFIFGAIMALLGLSIFIATQKTRTQPS